MYRSLTGRIPLYPMLGGGCAPLDMDIPLRSHVWGTPGHTHPRTYPLPHPWKRHGTRDTPAPSPDRITDTYENITFPQLLLPTVMRNCILFAMNVKLHELSQLSDSISVMHEILVLTLINFMLITCNIHRARLFC